ncbi:hypothetical protein [Flavobacterium sp. UBA4854]|uniref:hypothetical protein n=1 Tax=Flavobacterium sp. UBA4854 TaxID=1946548 RepID=UPI00257F24D7|nr:hypothetical protein [Flavobacterium sp. UBA4854]
MKKNIFLFLIIVFASCTSPKKESKNNEKPSLLLIKVKWTTTYKNEVIHDSNFFSYDNHNRLKTLSMYGIKVDSLVYDQSGQIISFRKTDVSGTTKSKVSYLFNGITVNSQIAINKTYQSPREYTLTANFKKDKMGRIELEKESCWEYDRDGDIYEKESCLTQRSQPKDTVYANVYSLVGNAVFWQVLMGNAYQYGNKKRLTFNSQTTYSIEPFDVSNYSTPLNKKYPKKEVVDFGEGKTTVEYEYKKGVN